MSDVCEIMWPVDPMLVVSIIFLGFMALGPFAVAATLVLAVLRRTRSLGVAMLLWGVAGFFCVGVAAALRTTASGSSDDWLVPSGFCGLAGFTAFVLIGLMIYFRNRPNQAMQPTATGVQPHFR